MPCLADPLASLGIVEDEFSHKALIDLDGCQVSLERSKKDMHYLHFRHGCPQLLEEKLRLFQSMVEVLLPDVEDRFAITTLFVGRLVRTFPEYAQRLATIALESPEWDPKRAWSDSGYSNGVVMKFLQSPQFFLEMNDVLSELGFKGSVVSVEKVLMGMPHDLPFGLDLQAHPTALRTRLPFDAMTWLHLEPIAPSPSH